jgi:hypothetical protein
MRSRPFACRTVAVAPLLTSAEYQSIRPAVPVIPGRQDMQRPEYVPVTAHYVNPNGAPSPRRHAVITVAGVLVATALVALAVTVWTGWLAATSTVPPAPMVTPSTYGPPPVGAR